MGPTIFHVATVTVAMLVAGLVGVTLGGWAYAVDAWARRGRG